jgi:ATP-binding cassette subfamily B protein
MKNQINFTNVRNLIGLIGNLSKYRKTQLIQLLILMLMGGIAEFISLGAIVPFLAILIDTQQALDIPFVVFVLDVININPSDDIYKQITILFIFVIIISNIIRFLLLTTIMKFNFSLGHDLGIKIYRNSLNTPYAECVLRNSSEIVGGINKLEHLTWIVLSIINAMSGVIMIFFIFITILLISPVFASTLFLSLFAVYSIFFLISKNKLKKSSFIIGENSNKRVQLIQEGLGSIRDILLNHNQLVFLNQFKEIDLEMRNAQISNSIIGASPRFIIEAFAMVAIVLIAYFSISNNNTSTAYIVSTLGALTLGLQRLVPLAQHVYSGWTQFSGNKNILNDVMKLAKSSKLGEMDKKVKSISFNRAIEFKNVSFFYNNNESLVVDNVNFLIKKGTMVGLIGATGSGKTTIVDLLSTLLNPTNGEILVDNSPLNDNFYFKWKEKITYVSQHIYLLDASFAQNIAFGLSNNEIDLNIVKSVADQAQISKFIENNNNGYQTIIGENGVFLSGGQKQRIGIARALYKNSQILIFDEATSALDSETEENIILSIKNFKKDITIIIISHRATTMKYCDSIYKITDGKVTKEQ